MKRLTTPRSTARLGIFPFFGIALFALACDPPAPNATAATATPTPSATTAASSQGSAAAAKVDKPVDRAKLQTHAEDLARKLIIVDGHVDLPYRLQEQKTEKGKITDNPAEACPAGNFDFPRAKVGGLDAPFMSIYVPARHQTEGGAKALADELIDMVEGICKTSPDKFMIAKSPSDVEQAHDKGMIALPMGIENGAALEGDLANVKHFFDRGVRYITLTHSEDNDICDSSYATTHKNSGLSKLGERVVLEMNKHGIMVDVAHISDDAFWKVMSVSQAPVIASHSSLRHFTPGFERNLGDRMVKEIGAKGGVVMINFGSSFIDTSAQKKRSEAWKARKAFRDKEKLESDDPKVKAFGEEYAKTHDLPFATVEQVADHIMRAVEIAGIDHVGLGSDFDGVGDSLPTDLKDVSQLPNLFRVLLERGLDDAAIAKIASGNVLRVWREVEEVAKKSGD